MRSSLHPAALSFTIPVPVRPGDFTPLFPEHAAWGVEACPGDIPSFSDNRTLVPDDELLWCDLQSVPHLYCRGRLGAGRSGVYRGKYLKGVGRTPLAANWNNEDRYHNSGHLLASAAIRELLVSSYFRARGEAASLVPCEGLLFRPLDPRLAGYASLWDDPATVPEIDRRFQAISIKPAGFLRFSNLLWQIHHLMSDHDHGQLPETLRNVIGQASALMEASLGTLEVPLPADEAERFLSLLAAAITRMEHHLAVFRRVGVYWGSVQNNFTVDGRFLDLEIAMITGLTTPSAMAGDAHEQVVLPLKGKLVGMELLQYVAALRNFFRYFPATVRAYRDVEPRLASGERDFADALLRGMRERFSSRRAWFFSRREVVARFERLMLGSLDLPRPAARAMRRYVAFLYDRFFTGGGAVSEGLSMSRIPAPGKFLLEPGRFHAFFHWEAVDPAPDEIEVYRYFHSLLQELHGQADLETLKGRLLEADGEIQRRFACGQGDVLTGSGGLAGATASMPKGDVACG